MTVQTSIQAKINNLEGGRLVKGISLEITRRIFDIMGHAWKSVAW